MNYNKDYFNQRYQKSVAGFSPESRRAYLYRARLRMLKSLNLSASKVLEIGCGVGPMTRHLAAEYKEVMAIDISSYAVDICKSTITENNIDFKVAAAENLPCESSNIDIAFAFDVYEHVEDLDLCYQEVFRVLKPGGILFISVPNVNSLGAKIKGRYPEYKGLPLTKRKKQWFGWQDDTHINIWPIDQWRDLAQGSGFEIVKDGTDYWWDSPYVKWLPTLLQDVVCKILHRVLTRVSYFMSWELGENYIGIYRKR